MGEFIELIDSIAFQTNILALNASIEAARAGEHGRGFAVVATEVRLLAGRSAEAARDIRQLIDHSTSEIGEGVALVKAAESSIDEVIASVVKVSDIMGEISSASSEQSAGIAQVSQAIVQLDGVTQKNAGMVNHAQQVSGSLQAQVRELVQAISIFKVDSRQLLEPDLQHMRAAFDEVLPPRGPVNALAPRLRNGKAATAEESWEAF